MRSRPSVRGSSFQIVDALSEVSTAWGQYGVGQYGVAVAKILSSGLWKLFHL